MTFARNHIIVNLLISVSFVLFIIGIFSPLMTVQKWYIFENKFSLLSGLMQFLSARQYLLFIIVSLFSVAIPLVKMILVAVVTNTSSWNKSGRYNITYWLSLIGKWSMMDVFIVAILVIVGKFRGVAEVEIHYGLYMFAASVILIQIVTCQIETGEKYTDMQDTT